MTESVFPEPLEDDDDDVAWAVQTAKVQWNRGGQADAIVWLRRAADSADQLGLVWRAADLRRSADELSASLTFEQPAPPEAPLPRWHPSNEGDPLDTEESGVTSIPPHAAPPSSYASIDEFEVEEIEPLEDDEHAVVRSQLLGDEVELTEEVELLDEAEDEFDEDIIDDDALSVGPASDEPTTEPHALDTRPEFDEPGTLPRQGGLSSADFLRRSPLPPPRRANSSLPVNAPPVVAAPAPVTEPDPRIGDVLLGEVRGLEDVPPEGQAILMREARIEYLAAEEEVRSFGLALVLRGAVNVMPAIADLSCARAGKGEIVWSQGNLDDGVVLRLVAAEPSTEVAVWDADLLKSTVRDYPWVVDDLKVLADRFQALAGVAMGPLGERLDDALRALVTERCEIRRLLPGEQLTTQGKPVGGMYIVAAGRLEVLSGSSVDDELGPGDFLFGAQVLSNGAAPNDSRAGSGGALVLFAARAIAHELLLSVPPLLEIFAT